MDLVTVSKALGSETRLDLLRLLERSPGNAAAVHRQYVAEYEETIRRESVYKALERLVEADLVDKRYDQTEKQILYSIKHEQLLVDLEAQSVRPPG